MNKKSIAAVALVATMVAPASFSATVATNDYVASAAATTPEAGEVPVRFSVKEAGVESKVPVTVEIVEKGLATATPITWSSVDQKEVKLTKGKTYTFTVKNVPEGYTVATPSQDIEIKADAAACDVTIEITSKATGTQTPDTATKRKVEVQHLDSVTKKPLAGGRVEISEKDKLGVLHTIDFSKPNSNVVELEVGKNYVITFQENYAGYAHMKDKYEVSVEAAKDGKVENQVVVIESKKIETSKPVDGSVVEKKLVLQHIDKSTGKEIKSGEVSIVEEGKDEKTAQKYDFSKNDNNIKVVNGKSYVLKFTRLANGYAPVSISQTFKADFRAADGADTYILKVYSNPVTVQQNTNGTQTNGTNSSTGLPQTGVATTSFGVALAGAIGSGFAVFRKRK